MLTTEHKQILFILGLDRAVAALEAAADVAPSPEQARFVKGALALLDLIPRDNVDPVHLAMARLDDHRKP